MSETRQGNTQAISDAINLAANDEKLTKERGELAHFTSKSFLSVGTELHVLGHVVGSDRIGGVSPFGHGSDETLPFPYCFESQVNSCRQVQICLKTAASMPQRHCFGRWLRLNILPGPWKREIATASAGFEVTGRVGRHFSLHASSEAPLPESSAEKIMGTIANWVDIQFRERASCWATIQSSRSFCWLTFLDTQAASGTISLCGHGEIRTASQSLGMA
jgi:hypothetical protein